MSQKFITRTRIKTDQAAGAWLITRFIDPAAELLFVPAEQVMTIAAREGATPYAFGKNIELSYHEDACSFEAFLKRYQLVDDPALAGLAKIVRSAEILSQKTLAPEGAGLEALAFGLRLQGKSDPELLEIYRPIFDALYLYCQAKARGNPKHQASQ